MIRRPPRSTLSSSSAASDVYKRQLQVFCRDVRAVHRESRFVFSGGGGGLAHCAATGNGRRDFLCVVHLLHLSCVPYLTRRSLGCRKNPFISASCPHQE